MRPFCSPPTAPPLLLPLLPLPPPLTCRTSPESENVLCCVSTGQAKREEQKEACFSCCAAAGWYLLCALPTCRCSPESEYIYGRVPTKHDYILAGCLHLCLCPQQRCDPQCKGEYACVAHCCANFPLSWLFGGCGVQSTDHWATSPDGGGHPMCAPPRPIRTHAPYETTT